MSGRPEARSFQVDQLMQLAREGRLRLPAFQRPLKWEPSDRLALFDSVDRGYPIGTLLFWRSPTEPGRVEWFETRRDVPGSADSFLVVDGQQRVATLAAALLAEEDDTRERELVFDLTERAFRWSRGASKIAPSVPARVLLDAADLGEWVFGKRLDKTLAREAFELGKRVREFTVPAYVVGAEQETVLRHVFHRMNTAGKSLTRAEVFDAMMVAARPGGLEGVRGVVEELRGLGFGVLDGDVVLASLEAVLRLPIGRDETKKLAPREASEALLRARDALARTIEFLQRECGVPRIEWLPYTLPVTVLARFFDAFEKPAPRTRSLLRRWFWRGAIEGRHSGTSSSLQEHVRDVRDDDEAGSVARLLARSGASPGHVRAPTLSNPFNVKHAQGCLELCALAAMRPRDLATGELVALSGIEASELAQVGTILEGERSVSSDLRSTLANRLLYPKVPGRRPGRLLLESSDPGALMSHGISTKAHRALQRRDFDGFLEERSNELRVVVEAFRDRMAEWGADDGPALSHLRLGA